MTVITATEFKANLGHYLDRAAEEDVIILRQGRPSARLSSPAIDPVEALNRLVGVASSITMTDDELKAERLSRK